MVSEEWGKAVICGNTAWDLIGRSKAKAEVEDYILPTPHLIRELANIKITRVVTGPTSCHSVLISDQGEAWVLGRNERGQLGLGHKNAAAFPVRITSVPENAKLLKNEKVVGAATGRHHTLIWTDKGEVFSTGDNKYGQLGLTNDLREHLRFARVSSLSKAKIVTAACGAEFTLVCTDEGKTYAFGSQEYGQLGNSKDGQFIKSAGQLQTQPQPYPTLVKSLEEKHVVKVACGTNHSLALDKEGFVYSWGFGGYGRLGHGEQKDLFSPQIVKGMIGPGGQPRATAIACGSTCSMALDDQSQFYLWGKWKNTGDGSAGQPWMSPRPMYELNGLKVRDLSGGAQSLFIIDDDEPMTVGWGQVQNAELGLSIEGPHSSTKPQKLESLEGIRTLRVSAGLGHTLFIVAAEGEAILDLPKWPAVPEGDGICIKCRKDENDGELLLCDKCDDPIHTYCANPPITQVPEGDWFCSKCMSPPPETKKRSTTATASGATKKKRNQKESM